MCICVVQGYVYLICIYLYEYAGSMDKGKQAKFILVAHS